MLPQQELVNFVVVTCFISAKIEKFYETLTTDYIFLLNQSTACGFAEQCHTETGLVLIGRMRYEYK